MKTEKTVDANFKRACTEALEVIYNMSISEFNKIPDKFLDVLEENSSEEYKYDYDILKPLEEQKISTEAKDILGVVFIQYLATEEERNKLKLLNQEYTSKMSEFYKKFDNTSDIDVEENVEYENEENLNNKELIPVKENIFTKIINFIKKYIVKA